MVAGFFMNFRKVIFIQCLFLATFNLFGPKKLKEKTSESIPTQVGQRSNEQPSSATVDNSSKQSEQFLASKKASLNNQPSIKAAQAAQKTINELDFLRKKDKIALNKAVNQGEKKFVNAVYNALLEKQDKDQESGLKDFEVMRKSLYYPDSSKVIKKKKKVKKPRETRSLLDANQSTTRQPFPEAAVQIKSIKVAEDVTPIPSVGKAKTMLNSAKNAIGNAIKERIVFDRQLNQKLKVYPEDENQNNDLKVIESLLAKKDPDEEDLNKLRSLADLYLPRYELERKMLEELNTRQEVLKQEMEKTAPAETQLSTRPSKQQLPLVIEDVF